MNTNPNLARRHFIVASTAAAGGLALGVLAPWNDAQAQASGAVPEVNAWVVVKPDDSVVIRIARTEMGQGSMTGLAQLVAEELECDWRKVTTEYPTPGQNAARKRVWRDFATGGSSGIRRSHEYVRQGGAAAREMLIQAAANEWKVAAAECSAAAGVITHRPSGRMTTFGKVAAAAAKLAPPKDVKLKDPKDWKIAGKPMKRLDVPDKITGKYMFGADLMLPGMLNATLKQCPVFGGKLKRFDASRALAMKGVRKVLTIGDQAVVAVADTWWQAKTALDAVTIEWDEGAHRKVSSESIAEWLQAGLTAPNAAVGNRNGDARAAIAAAAKTVEAVYARPYIAHATMEPMNATARVTAQRCEVWCPTQNGEAAFAAAMAASGLAAEQCEVYKIDPGCGFGRRGDQDYVTLAVQVAKQIPGVPVKLLWTREEDMTQDRYHPTTQCRLVGAFDANNNLTALHMRLSGQSIMGSRRADLYRDGVDPQSLQGLQAEGEYQLGYAIPNLLIDQSIRNPHVPPGFWRAVNANQNAIYLECFIDELAHAVGQDALEFRHKLMSRHPKHRAVLDAAAARGGWGKPAPKGVHRGLAQFMAFGGYAAACAEVSVDGDKVKIHRIAAAVDPGHVVNPAQIERQVAGSFVFGLSALFEQESTVKDGRIVEKNFDTFDSMTIAQMPRVDVVLVPSGGFWGGIGEPTTTVAAPAVLNAIFRATGKRYRSFPLRKHGLKLV